MSDFDVFETRFAAAYRRYLDEVPTGVDAAEVVRAITTAQPLRRTRGWPWALRPASALAWLVLLALVLAALGAAIFVGSHRPALAFACPAGTNPDAPGPVDQARPPMAYTAPMAFDRHAGRLVLLVDGYDTGPETWTFDVCTNTWTRMHPNREPSDARQLVYDVDSDLTITVDADVAWAYDLDANTWTAKGFTPMFPAAPDRLAYDAVSGLVVAQMRPSLAETDPAELWTYDVETDTWTPVRQASASDLSHGSAREVLAYDASVDRLISYEPVTDGTRLFDLRTGTWSRSGTVTPMVNFGWGPSGGEIAYDEAVRQTIVFSYGRIIAYDAVADRWDVLIAGWDPDQPGSFSGPTCLSMPSIAYDPVSQRLVVYGGQYLTSELDAEGGPIWLQSDQVLAFDPATREWTTLLASTAATRPR